MNHQILIPRRSHNPGWLVRLARWIGKQRKLYELRRFYRGLGHSRAEARQKAELTL